MKNRLGTVQRVASFIIALTPLTGATAGEEEVERFLNSPPAQDTFDPTSACGQGRQLLCVHA